MVEKTDDSEEIYPGEEQEMEKPSDDPNDKDAEVTAEDGEVSPEEEGFIKGASGEGQGGVCAKCGKVLEQDDKSHIVEKEVDGEVKWFCSDECADS